MNSTNDKVKGTFSSSVGKTKEVAGQVMNDQDLQAEGSAQKTAGKAQKMMGDLKAKIHTVSHDLGDNIEKVGKKLQEKGHGKVGRTIEKMGDKLEHAAD